jgi:hypothetical protein
MSNRDQVDIINGPNRITEKVSVKIIHDDGSVEDVPVPDEEKSGDDGEAS